MPRLRLAKIIAAGGLPFAAAIALPGAAQAQILSPCLVLGSPMPPPCITIDNKRLADIARQNAQELEKIRQTVQTIQQARTAANGIVSDVVNLADFHFDFTPPNVDTNVGPLLQGAANSLLGQGRNAIQSIASKAAENLFAGPDASIQAVNQATARREGMIRDANAEAFAYGIQGVTETENANTRYATLASRACKSRDARTDWAVNSAIKIELLNARARQSYLLSAYLRMRSTVATEGMNSRLAQGYQPSAIAAVAQQAVNAIDQSGKVDALQSLLSRARSVLGSLSVVQMSQSVQQSLQGVISDYQSTTQRKAQLLSQLTSAAASWAAHSHRGSAQSIVSTVLSSLDNLDGQLSSLAQQPVEALAGAFQQRGIDATSLIQNDVDPREFIGTWTDPMKAQNTLNLANGLLRGALDSAIEGDHDNDQFRQLVSDFNDVRLEEAWKKALADEAQQELDRSRAVVAQEIQQQGGTLTVDGVTSDLEDIVRQANELGQQIGQGEDAGSKERAAAILSQLQQAVGGGTSLPSGQVDADGNPYPGAESGGTPVTTPTDTPQVDEQTTPQRTIPPVKFGGTELPQ